MTETKYTLKAYKPDSEDSCMGCHMASYESDYICLGPLSEDELIKEIAKIEATELGINEEGYDVSYSICCLCHSILFEKRDMIDAKASLLAKEIKKKRKKERKKLEKKKFKDSLDKIKQDELDTLKKLKEKYE